MDFFSNLKKTLQKIDIYFSYTLSKKSPRFLYPVEKRYIKKAVAKRQADFSSGRWCARSSMASLGIQQGPILQDRAGQPVWPKGICGSITHTDRACCSVLAFKKDYISLGLDLERRKRLISPGAGRIILNDDETAWINRSGRNKDFLIKFVFCAKESVFKLLYPLTGKRFYFSDVSILPPDKKNRFEFRLKRTLHADLKKGRLMHGVYFADKKWVLVLASLPSA